ncbi:hypothetical protein ACFSC4_26525 [Deinococcus malanensis]|uniref:hypothetical protein n=1 Tax=Deinococcus malanensis TaxID=1706855 RepID=UPI0036258FFC
MWIDADRLLSRDDLPHQMLTVQIYRPDGTGLLLSREQVVGRASLTFRVEKKLGTSLQPFPVRFERAVPWTAWPWTSIAAWWVTTAVAALWVVRLVTARRRSERALQDERHRAEGILRSTTDGIVALDPKDSSFRPIPPLSRCWVTCRSAWTSARRWCSMRPSPRNRSTPTASGPVTPRVPCRRALPCAAERRRFSSKVPSLRCSGTPGRCSAGSSPCVR